MESKKQLWMLVGGNGVGKSTFYTHYLKPLDLPFVNADLIAQTEFADNPEAHSYEAAKLAEDLRTELLLSGSSFCFETVYSHPSKIDFLAQAKARNYEIIMIFIHLQTVGLNQARVAQRIAEGGHSVPIEKIVSRIPRTLQHVKHSIGLCDQLHVLDNSSAEEPFKRLLTINNGVLMLHTDRLPDWTQDLVNEWL